MSNHFQPKELNNDLFTENFADLFADSIKEECKEGTVSRGVIVAIDHDSLLVDVGLKSEGRIALKEFASADGIVPELSVGGMVDVYIEKVDGRGKTILSREKAVREESWRKFEDLHKQEVNVDGIIIGRVKGGFAVELGGIIAFLPGSQVDIRPIKDMATLMNISQPFKILKMDRDQGNIVVSRRAILEESRKEARSELLSTIAEGSVLDGVVKNITDYGAFIDLGSIDGLLHITDIAWNKISHPSEVLTIGQQIKVCVIKYNHETQRVSLGLKQLEQNPWEKFSSKYVAGAKFKGIVSTVADYGAFIELEAGVEGLVHHSEIAWNSKNIHPRKMIKPGDEVEVMVLELDISKHRISLSIKRCQPNPWILFVESNPIGSVVEGVVSNIADFGMFITIHYDNPDLAIDALIPAVELSWEENPEKDLKKYKRDDVVKGVVLTADADRERITVGIKQLDPSKAPSGEGSGPSFMKYEKNAVYTCVVKEVSDQGIVVDLEGEAVLIKKTDLSKHKEEKNPYRFAVGERIDAKVVGYDKTAKVVLSIKALEMDQARKAIEEYGSMDSGASLGDILGAALNKNEEK
jgi:small subunit ribosomal protein S1